MRFFWSRRRLDEDTRKFPSPAPGHLGVRVDRILTFNLSLPTVRYDAVRRTLFQEELVRRLETIPGVSTAGGTSRLPATGDFHAWPTAIESGPLVGTIIRATLQPQHRTVSGHFFQVFQIPVLAGRVFDEHDDASAPSRAVVSASFARQFYPGLSFDQVVGQRFRFLDDRRREIVGVVGDVALDVYGAQPHHIYHAHRQFADNRNWALTGVVATEVARWLALMLAALGLFGVLAYTVRQRTQEIGIRIALGATTRQVQALVLRQAALVLAVGLAVATGGALALGRWLSSLAFQVSPSDPRILGATALLLALTGLLSAWLPIRRASRVNPTAAIKEGWTLPV